MDRTDGLARVVIELHGARNALDLAVADDLPAVATTLGENPDARCVVRTNEGDFFGVGADLGRLDGDDGDAPVCRRLA